MNLQLDCPSNLSQAEERQVDIPRLIYSHSGKIFLFIKLSMRICTLAYWAIFCYKDHKHVHLAL